MRKIVAVCFISLLFAVTSCEREVEPFLGDYSYKLSGEVVLTDADGHVTYRLIHRNGQMNILEDRNAGNRLLITMNEMNGGCYTMSAIVKGDSLLLEPYEVNINILTQDGTSIFDSDNESSLVYRVVSSGSGMLNGKMLVLDESWSGHQSGNEELTLSGPQMKIIAEKN